MKKEELTALGLTDEQADAVFALNGKDVEGAKAKFADYETIKSQLAEANSKLEGFDPEWKAKAEQAERDAAAKIAEMEFQTLLTAAISGAKARNVKTVAALLDTEGLKASKNQEADIRAALDTLKKGEDTAFLFEQAAPAKTGLSHQGGQEEAADKKEAANEALRAVFGKEN